MTQSVLQLDFLPDGLSFQDDHLILIDQRQVDKYTIPLTFTRAQEVAHAINSGIVRGLVNPALAAGYAIVLSAMRKRSTSDWNQAIKADFDVLKANRTGDQFVQLMLNSQLSELKSKIAEGARSDEIIASLKSVVEQFQHRLTNRNGSSLLTKFIKSKSNTPVHFDFISEGLGHLGMGASAFFDQSSYAHIQPTELPAGLHWQLNQANHVCKEIEGPTDHNDKTLHCVLVAIYGKTERNKWLIGKEDHAHLESLNKNNASLTLLGCVLQEAITYPTIPSKNLQVIPVDPETFTDILLLD